MLQNSISISNISQLGEAIISSFDCLNGYWDKNQKKCILYSKLKSKCHNLRKMLQNDTIPYISLKEENSEYKMHIKMIIIIAIIFIGLAALIGSVFLVLYLRKKCKKKKEEKNEKKEESKDISNFISNSKMSRRGKRSLEMSNIFSNGKNTFRTSIPIKKNKTFSVNPLMSSIKLRSCHKIELNINDEDKIINSNNNDEQNIGEKAIKQKDYSEFTFCTNSDIKENDLGDILKNL